MSIVKPVPDGMHTVTPHLVCAGASDAIEFYKEAFSATEMNRLVGSNGKIMNAMIKIGDSPLMLVDENQEWGVLDPHSLKGTPVTLHLYVEDADTLFKLAVDAGAIVVTPLKDMFWGDRYGIVRDPFGHLWSIATHMRDLTHDEIANAMSSAN